MQLGTVISAPKGYKQLRQDTTYYLLRSDTTLDRVLLVFWPRKDDAVLLSMPQFHFEQGLQQGLLKATDPDNSLPPWLLLDDGRTVEEVSASWSIEAVAKHRARIQRRLDLIASVTAKLDTILQSAKPARLINEAAMACVPKQNIKRFRSWVFVWAVFGSAGLHYDTRRIGRWDRCQEGRMKAGRKSLQDPSGGHTVADRTSIQNILLGYERYSGLGISMPDIYRKTLRNVFGCLEATDVNGVARLYHPDGDSFPSLHQFRYRVYLLVGKDHVRVRRLGAQHVRNHYEPSRGAFSESVSNLHELVEGDGYWIKELPKAYIDSSPLPPICTVRLRDLCSGLLIGIGFSMGGETLQAYLLACFCAAIPKDVFGRLIGMPITIADWPSQGLPLTLTTDRGPGAPTSKSVVAEGAPGGQEMTPSYSPQSKAGIETSNPHHIKFSGPPTYVQSDLSPVDLMRGEVKRTLTQNATADVSDRLTPDMVRAEVLGTPNSIFHYLDSVGRNDARKMSFNEAVRSFLPRIGFEVRRERDGVYFRQQRFDSEALRATGILDNMPAGTTLPGFHFTVLRYAWVEIGGQLIEVNATLPLRDDAEQLFVSAEELAQIDELKRRSGSRLRSHAQAAKSKFERQFEEDTGMSMDAGCRRRGRPKKTAAGRQEAAEIRAHLSPKSKLQ